MLKVKVSLGLMIGVLLATVALAQSFTASPNAPITSGNVTTSTINVPDGATITDVQVAVSISHSHGGDLTIDLMHEPTNGIPRTITLLRGLNLAGFLHGCGADAINASFSDAAGAAMDNFDCSSNFDAPVTGVWRPSDALSSFDGRNVGGTWTLMVNDRLPSDDGTLVGWGLTFNSTEAPAPGGSGIPLIGGREAPLCSDLDGSTNTVVRAVFPNGDTDLYCRIIAEYTNFVTDSAEIGDEGVINQGVIQAVDVYSLIGAANPAGAQVCLEGSGSLIFMDANNAPRVPEWLPSYVRGDYTCGRVNTVGTVVLVEKGPNGEAAAVIEESSDAPVSSSLVGATFADTIWSGTALTGCEITTGDILNIRTQPGMSGRVITQVPYGLKLEAVAVQGDWYRVIYLNGQGWLNVEYLNLGSGC